MEFPTEYAIRRNGFYEAVHRLFMVHLGKRMMFSAQFCYLTEGKELAVEFLKVVKRFDGGFSSPIEP